MRFVSLDDFLDDVMPSVPGCSKYTARDRLRLAAIEFCKKTGVSVETTREIDLEAGEAEIQVPIPGSNVIPLHVLWAETTYSPVRVLDRQYINERGALVNGSRESSWPRFLKRVTRDIYELDPVPSVDRDEAFTIHASYIPKKDATSLDAVLFEDYREAIAAGALYRLLSMSGEAWANPEAAARHKADFRYQIKEARAMASKDFTTSGSRMVIRPLA